MTLPLPPLVYGPIYSAAQGQTPARSIHVGNVLPGATVTIYTQAAVQASTVQVGQSTSTNGGDVWIPITPPLQKGSLVSATQEITAITSALSNTVLVLQFPKELPIPVFLSPLETCMGAIRLGNLIQACTLHITNSAGKVVLQTVVSQPVDSEQSFELPSTPAEAAAVTAGTTLTAWQTFEGALGHTTSSGPVVTTPNVVPNTPVIGPVWPCQTAINLSNLNPGADLKVTNGGNETLFSNTYNDLELFLVAPLVPGDLIVTQYYRRCPHVPTAEAKVTVVERPLPPLSISFAASNIEALLVSGVVPGEILSVYQEIPGASPQLLGEQQVTDEPATVNLPSLLPAVANGTAVSLGVSGALCNNAPPAQAKATLALPPPPRSEQHGVLQPFGGNNQYILYGGPSPDSDRHVPLLGLVIDIAISEPIVVAPNSLPIGFQVNGYSQHGDNTIGAQQFAVRMWPNSSQLNSIAENWPPGYPANPNLSNVINLSPSANKVPLPNETTIPAGWTIRIKFQYYQGGDLISGYTCSVIDDATGTQVGHSLDIPLFGQPLANGTGTIKEGDLAQCVAFEVVLVGFWNGAIATLTSGAGTITYKSTTPLLAITQWPTESDASSNIYTQEDTNSTYGLMPAQASTHIVQSFGVTS
jgi:hypothetical protein